MFKKMTTLKWIQIIYQKIKSCSKVSNNNNLFKITVVKRLLKLIKITRYYCTDFILLDFIIIYYLQ